MDSQIPIYFKRLPISRIDILRCCLIVSGRARTQSTLPAFLLHASTYMLPSLPCCLAALCLLWRSTHPSCRARRCSCPLLAPLRLRSQTRPCWLSPAGLLILKQTLKQTLARIQLKQTLKQTRIQLKQTLARLETSTASILPRLRQRRRSPSSRSPQSRGPRAENAAAARARSPQSRRRPRSGRRRSWWSR